MFEDHSVEDAAPKRRREERRTVPCGNVSGGMNSGGYGRRLRIGEGTVNTLSAVRQIGTHPWRPITNRPQVDNLPHQAP